MKIDKEFTVVLTPKEVSDIIRNHIGNIKQLVVDDVTFKFEPTTDDYGNYSGYEFNKVICKGKLRDGDNN